MKRMLKTSTLLAALALITMAVTGCGKSSDSNGTGTPGGPGAPGFTGGVVQPLPGGAARITFSGTNVYDSGVRFYGTTPGYDTYTQYAGLSLGTANLPVGQLGTLTGKGRYYPYSTVNIAATTTSWPMSQLTGVIDLDPTFVQSAFQGGMPSVIGIKIDLYHSTTSIYGGTVWICTRQDSTGCHGAYLEI